MKSFFIKIRDRIKVWFTALVKEPVKVYTNILMFGMPLFTVWVIEMLNKRSVIKGFTCLFTDPLVFLLNYMIVFATISVVLLFRKRAAMIIALNVVWIGFGVANFILKGIRETPFSATDIKIAGSVTDIVEKYLSPTSFIIILMLLIVAVLLILFLWFKTPKYAKRINYFVNIIIMLIVMGSTLGFVKLGVKADIVSEKFPNMSIAYQDYGFVYCFSCSVINTGVERPRTYSTEGIEEIVEKLNTTVTVDDDNVQTPNIIFLQLESFFDVTKMKDLELSEDPIPTFNQLKEDFPSGFLTVNNYGYGTANTEFEVMTGMNLDDFGPGEFPYKTILKKQTCESIAYVLKDYGYATHAMHNNNAAFYDRHKVFKNLGYDTFTSLEFMIPEEFTEVKWAKDKVLTGEILEVLNYTDEKDYLYCISVQGHGVYPKEPILEDPVVQVGGLGDKDREYQFLYYVNQLKEMDDFIKELIKELEYFGEDTVLVMYGDHFPSLSVTDDELTKGNVYQTEYIIWNNMGIELEDKDIETYQLYSRVLQALNIDGGYINKYHQIYQDDEHYLEQLKTLTYDMLYGDKHIFDGVNPYISTDLTLGTYPITIKKVIKDYTVDIDDDITDDTADDNAGVSDDNANNETGSNGENVTGESETETETTEEETTKNKDYENKERYLVLGSNFTSYSHVSINGTQVTTEFVDENTLRIYVDEPIASFSSIVVNQKWKASIVSKTSEYIYITVDNGGEDATNETEGEDAEAQNEKELNNEEEMTTPY